MALSQDYDDQACWILPRRLRLELLAALSTDPVQTATMTYDDFLEWADEDTLAEWVDGRDAYLRYLRERIQQATS